MIRGEFFDTLCAVTEETGDRLEYERVLIERGEVVVGIDEVGRGALAGPMLVGAVVVGDVRPPPAGLRDSKRLTSAQRDALVAPIEAWALGWSLGSTSAREIDEWGLRLALAVAATRALEGLRVVPTHALVDGSFNLLRAPGDLPLAASAPPPLRFDSLPVTTIVGGDDRSATIAAASVLAKVRRDALMVALDGEARDYQWARNKGYGAPAHLEEIRRSGVTAHHRRSWKLPEVRG